MNVFTLMKNTCTLMTVSIQKDGNRALGLSKYLLIMIEVAVSV